MNLHEKTIHHIATSDITLDESIYPRETIDHKRVSLFAENLRDHFKFDPIDVQIHPEKKSKYRILDGVHRWNVHKAIGSTTMPVRIKTLKEKFAKCLKMARH